MLALFSESVGTFSVKFLEKYGIASVWRENGPGLVHRPPRQQDSPPDRYQQDHVQPPLPSAPTPAGPIDAPPARHHRSTTNRTYCKITEPAREPDHHRPK
ncbi:hypothetical protein ACFFS4_21070, partial [Kutzneria kofuensis]